MDEILGGHSAKRQREFPLSLQSETIQACFANPENVTVYVRTSLFPFLRVARCFLSFTCRNTSNVRTMRSAKWTFQTEDSASDVGYANALKLG